MSEDNAKGQLLDFLASNTSGRDRDAVTRAFYEYAEGNPHSHPIGMAILLIACARQMARLPEDVRSSAKEFQSILDKVIEVDRRLGTRIDGHQLQWKKDLSHALIGFMGDLRGETTRAVAAMETENARAESSWRAATERLGQILNETDQVNRRLNPIVDAARRIAQDFSGLRFELKIHEASEQVIADQVESLKLIHQQHISQGEKTHGLIQSLTKEARASWITIGYLTGIFLAALFFHLPWWGTWLSFVAMLGLVQWFARQGWSFDSIVKLIQPVLRFLRVFRRCHKP